MADAALAEIRKLTPLRIRYIINTAEDDDRVGGNEKFARAGESLFVTGNLGPGGGGNFTGITNEGAASIIGTENMSLRMSGSGGAPSRYATVAQPSETFARRQKLMYLNDESIQVIHTAPGHTDGDAIVLFRQSDVIVAGDVFDMTRFPFIDLTRGGSVQGEIETLNQLIDLTVPSIPLPWKEGGTTVIPGHGRLSQQAELVEYRDMVAIIADRVKTMIQDGMSLDQVKKAKPTSGWDRRFGSPSALSRDSSREPWTTDMFVEAVYKSLSPTAKPRK
jgi:glyoxylase-like metal-dependent hydrolase (beta-lactamase superfamily II)